VPAHPDPALFASLQRSPLLAGLAHELIAELAARTHCRMLRTGEVLFRIGEPGQEFYLIAGGRIRLLGPREQGEPVVNELGPGEWFGEMALLTGEPRSATAVAATDATLLSIARADFHQLLRQAPAVALGLSHYLSHRLRMQTLLQPRRAPPGVIAMVTATPGIEEARLILNLAAALADTGAIRVAIVDHVTVLPLRPLVEANGFEGVTVVADSSPDLPTLRADYSLVLIRVATTDPQAVAWLRKAEAVWALDITDERATAWIKNTGEFERWTTIRCPHSHACRSPGDIVLDPAVMDPAPIVHQAPQSNAARSLRRFARQVLGRRVGLALSAGGAKALAHLGVLRCFERAGLEFDLIAGASMGGVIGGLFAMGQGSDVLLEGFRDLARNFRRQLLDFGIPDASLLRGVKKQGLLQHYARDVHIEALPIPFWTVAADLASGCEVGLGSGPLWQALDATSAIPAIFPPVVVDGRILVDGWIVNPLPADILRREGADIVVASATSAQVEPISVFRRPIQATGLAEQFGNWNRRLTYPAIIRIAMRALDVGARERTLANLAFADASVQPEVGSFSPTEFGRLEEIVELGERAAEEALPAILHVMRDRGKPY
jgi:NTE family protein